jgi:prevent-host-death family protein
MSEQTVNVADAKKHLSELLGRVAYGKEQIIITKREKPMVRLVPAEGETKLLNTHHPPYRRLQDHLLLAWRIVNPMISSPS